MHARRGEGDGARSDLCTRTALRGNTRKRLTGRRHNVTHLRRCALELRDARGDSARGARHGGDSLAKGRRTGAHRRKSRLQGRDAASDSRNGTRHRRKGRRESRRAGSESARARADGAGGTELNADGAHAGCELRHGIAKPGCIGFIAGLPRTQKGALDGQKADKGRHRRTCGLCGQRRHLLGVRGGLQARRLIRRLGTGEL